MEEGLCGTVVVSFVVSKSGSVVHPKIVSSTNRGFEEPSLEAILAWKYKPAMKGGKPVDFPMKVPVEYVCGFDDEYPTRVLESLSDYGPGDSPPHLVTTRPIVYPYELERRGVSGRAKVRMLVSKNGEVAGVTILSSSQPEFGLALAAAAQGFFYASAIKGEHSYRCITEFSQDFDASHPLNPDDVRLLSMESQGGGVYPVAGLDGQPRLLKTRRILYPSALEGTGLIGDATVEFLIQEDGMVRLPRIVHASKPEFGYAAVEAVASWRFEPPRFHGKPVVARVRESFNFKPKPEYP
jgi:TonB family protein